MMQAIRQTVNVQAGGEIELSVPELEEGMMVEVIVPCLGLAMHRPLPVLTTDRAWTSLNLELAIRVIR